MKNLPHIPKGTDLKDVPEIYANFTKKVLPAVIIERKVDQSKIVYTLTTSEKDSLAVEYYYDPQGGAGINIHGVDTGYWHTGENTDIDDLHVPYFEVGLAALRGKWRKRKTLFGKEQIWFWIEEKGEWLFTRTAGNNRYHHVSIRKNFPGEKSG